MLILTQRLKRAGRQVGRQGERKTKDKQVGKERERQTGKEVQKHEKTERD